MTREKDITLTSNDRIKLVNTYNPDLCVSIHQNAFNSIARGAEVIHSHFHKEDDKLASAILDRLKKASIPTRRAFTKLNDQGKDWYYMIRSIVDSNTDAIIVEGGFIDNTEDAKLLKGDKYIKAQAKAIADSVIEYLDIPLKAKTDLEKALEFISNKSEIDYAHWYKQAKEVKYLDDCFIKIAKGFGGIG